MKTGEQIYWVDPEGISSGIYVTFGINDSEEAYEIWNGYSATVVPKHECVNPEKLAGVYLESNIFCGPVKKGEELKYFEMMEEHSYDLAGFKNLIGTNIFTWYWSDDEKFGQTLKEYLKF